MSEDDKPQPVRSDAAPKADKAERLAAALRRNLARRKAQDRARRTDEPPATARDPEAE